MAILTVLKGVVSLLETGPQKMEDDYKYRLRLVFVVIFRFSRPSVSGREITMDVRWLVCVLLSFSKKS